MTTTTPIANSPLLHRHRQAGATIETINGWQVATHYPSEPEPGSNTLIDITHRPVFEIAGRNLSEQLHSLCGQDLPIRNIHVTDEWQCYRLTQDRAIAFGNISHPAAINVTGGWTSIALTGPNTRDILNKITALDLRDETLGLHRCSQAPIFGVNTLIAHFETHHELHCCPDSFEFLWTVLLDAGEEFQLQPTGLGQYSQFR